MVYKQGDGTPSLFHQERLEVLDDVTRFAVHVQIEVGPIERRASDERVCQVEALRYVVPNRGACCGRECHNGNLYNSRIKVFLKNKDKPSCTVGGITT